MDELNALRKIAHKAADQLLSYEWKIWFWGDSIGLEGLLDASELTGDERYRAYVHGLLKGWLPREQHRSQFDYTAPGVALLRVYEQTGDRTLLDAARRHGHYMAGFRRTTAGAYLRYENAAIELPPELPPDHPEQGGCGAAREPVSNGGPCVFVDSVHFDGPFFAKLHEVTGEPRYRQLALDNVLSQIELLYDRRERVFNHFWMEQTRQPNGIFWARGNGWGLLGVVLTIESLGVASHDVATLRELIAATLPRIAELQDGCGAWHTVVTDPSTYIESSTAAFFVDIICRAIRLGLVNAADYEHTIAKAVRYLIQNVSASGVLDGVSYETFPSTRPEHYGQMPRGAVVPWGQGPLLAAARSYCDFILGGRRDGILEERHASG